MGRRTDIPVDLVPASALSWSADDRKGAHRGVGCEEMRRLPRPTAKPTLGVLPCHNLVDRAKDETSRVNHSPCHAQYTHRCLLLGSKTTPMALKLWSVQ